MHILKRKREDSRISAKKYSFAQSYFSSLRGYSLKTSFDDVVIKAMSFRDKRLGWKKYSFAFVLSKASAAGEQNSVSLSYPFYDNPFMKGFLADLYLRPSCYACPAKKLKSGSDITLGDFWGIESVMPEIDDDKGASSVVVNTAKGKSILNSIRAEYHIVSYRQVCQKNPAIIRSCSVPYRRRAFSLHAENRLLIT